MKNLILIEFLLVSISMQPCKKEAVEIPTCENCSFTCLETNVDKPYRSADSFISTGIIYFAFGKN